MFYNEISRVAGLMTDYNFEFIFVNDGSRDNTLSVLKALSREEERMTVIHQENGGVSSARNAGLRAARGERSGIYTAALHA